MIDFESGIKNITKINLHSSLKKNLSKDSLSILDYYLKLYKTNYDENNIFIFYTSNTLILTGLKKDYFSLNNCIVNIFAFCFENGSFNEYFEDYFSREDVNRFISFILGQTFINLKFTKLSIEFPSNLNFIEKQLYDYKFYPEGLFKQRYNLSNKSFDGKLFSIQKSQFDSYSTGYIVHGVYNLKIRATNYAVLGIYSDSETDFENIENNSNNIENVNDKAKFVYSKVDNTKNQIREYFKGSRIDFDLKIQLPEVSEFQREVWKLCSSIPYGQTRSYEDISKILEDNKNSMDSKYSRAVGMALSKNPVLLAIPCHRVIGKNGKLRGFSAGIGFKDFLLKHEMMNTWSINN